MEAYEVIWNHQLQFDCQRDEPLTIGIDGRGIAVPYNTGWVVAEDFTATPHMIADSIYHHTGTMLYSIVQLCTDIHHNKMVVH